MRTCDVCNKPSPEAKGADSIIAAILKDAQITNSVRVEILDRLKIKHSVFQAKPAFGDVCDHCGAALEADITKTINGHIASLVDKLSEIASATKAKMLKTSNAMMFDEISSDAPWGRIVHK